MPATFKRISPYKDDALNLPVANVDEATGYYVKNFGFVIKERVEVPVKKTILERNSIQMGIAENGGDPGQEGCFIEVDNLSEMADELKTAGLQVDTKLRIDKHGDTSYKVFFVIAPDGLCYCFGERQV